MSNSKGRIILHQAIDPVTNMAMDEALARCCDEGMHGFPLIRFYWWTKPTLSLGAKERIDEAADRNACEKMGISLVRRPTGGRSVLHDKELTYAIIAPLGIPPFSQNVELSYRSIAEAQARGLAKLGIELQLTPGGRKVKPRTNPEGMMIAGQHLPCFAAPSRYELTWGGKKVVGSAQRRFRKAVLQHGSILQQSDVVRLSKATNGGDSGAETLSEIVIGLEEIAGRSIERNEIIEAMIPELSSIFPVEFDIGDLTEYEWNRTRELESIVRTRLEN